MTVVEAVAGVDLGTTSTKVLLRDTTGRQLALLEAATPWTTTPSGGTESTAETLVDTAVRLLRNALDAAEHAVAAPVQVLGLGVTGFAESGVLLDGSGAPCTPVVAWFDGRGAEQVRRISHRHPDFARTFVRHTGLSWDSQAAVAKIAWFAEHGVPVTGRHRWLSIPEFLVLQLGGALVSEPSLASRTGLLDQGTGRPWAEGAAAMGLPPTLLPEPTTAGTPGGRLRLDTLQQGYQGAVLTVAGHDHPVAAIGAGATGADELFNSTGTADVIARALPGRLTADQRERLVGHGISVGSHVLPHASLLLGGVRGGLLLRRVLTMLGATGGEAREQLDVASLAIGELPAGLVVSGAGPRRDEVCLQLKDDASPGAVWAAATRHVATETGALLDTVHRVVPPHRRAVAGGGWIRMASVRRAKAAAIDRLEFSEVIEPGVTGAAVLAQQAAARAPLSLHPTSSASPV